MTAAAPAASSDREGISGGSPLVDLEAAIAAVHPLLHALELRVSDLGVPVAPLYLAAARGSLRHVATCIARHLSRPRGREDVEEVVPGTGVVLIPDAARPGTATRGRRTPRGPRKDRCAEAPSWAACPDLGATLLGSSEASGMCAGPVGSTLMFCALAHHRWMHAATGAKWSTDLSGARAIVGAINGGSGCAVPVSGVATRCVDGEVLALLARLGWVRIVSPAMPRICRGE